jgi:hypothetical protein
MRKKALRIFLVLGVLVGSIMSLEPLEANHQYYCPPYYCYDPDCMCVFRCGSDPSNPFRCICSDYAICS